MVHGSTLVIFLVNFVKENINLSAKKTTNGFERTHIPCVQKYINKKIFHIVVYAGSFFR